MATTIRRYETTDAEWAFIKPCIPEEQEARSRGRPSKDSRAMLNGILWNLGNGSAWRDFTERYGSWQTVYKRFAKWSKSGIFEKIFKDLTADANMQDQYSQHLYQGSQSKCRCKKGNSDGVQTIP